MKHVLFTLASAVLLLFTACDKKDEQVMLEGGSAPVLSATIQNNGVIPMSYATRTEQAIVLNWTSPNYRFNTGAVSQDIVYQVEIDTVGANFTNPKKKVYSVSRDLSLTLTQNDLNDALLNQLFLVEDMPHTIEVRVTSQVGQGSGTALSSNTLKFTVTPFSTPPKVAPPASGELFITGSATPASWMNGGDAPLASQKFTRVSNTLFVLNSIPLSGGNSFLFVPVYGNWGDKYGFTGSGNANNVDSDEFMRGGNDIKAPAATRNYKIEVDFQRGRYTVTPI
ncbi:MAG: hypothetical protein EOO16_08020 [Chitinophagaceae bacterium]|nr:MAG: hypothetical protein EOO16_08020 [Chitinophagaceae bacterium]